MSFIPLLLEVLELILFRVKADIGTTAERRVNSVGGNGEGTSGGGLPDALLIVVALGDVLGDEVRRIETGALLTEHRSVRNSYRREFVRARRSRKDKHKRDLP